MNAALVSDLWSAASRLAHAEGVLQSGDGALHWTWYRDAEALGHDCRTVPEGFELAAVRIEPVSHGNNGARQMRVWRLQHPNGPGCEVLRVSWDEAEGTPSAQAGLHVEIFERGLWETALRQRAARHCGVSV